MTRNIAVLIVGLWFSFLLPNVAYSEGYALLIGIQNYPNFPELQGPINDIQLMKETLQKFIGIPEKNIMIIQDENATHTKIREAFITLSQKNIQPHDFVYIHYSGHGSRYPNKNQQQGDIEETKYDQTWLPYGARTGNMTGFDDFDIIDDQVDLWLQGIFDKTQHLVIVVDSCHSGTATKAQGAVRTIKPDKRPHPFISKQPRQNKQGIRIGAARDDESAMESRFRGKQYGVFTWFWANALKEKETKNWIDAFHKARQKTQEDRENNQNPQIEPPTN